MKNIPSWGLVPLLILVGALAGTAAAIASTQSLERYASALLDDRRFSALMPHRDTFAPATYEEALLAVQTTAQQSVVQFVDTAQDLHTRAPFLLGDAWVHGEGVVLSADGWVLTTREQLARYADGGAEFSGMSVVYDGEIFLLDRVVADTVTQAVAVHAVNAQGWTPGVFANEDAYLLGAQVFGGQGTMGRESATLVARMPQPTGIAPAELPSALWMLSHDLRVGSTIFDVRGDVLGFVGEDQFLLPITHVRAFVKQVLRGGAIAHAGLGAYVTDLSFPSSLDPAVRQGHATGALVFAPAAERSGILPNAPADLAGIADGDILLAVDGTVFTQSSGLAELLALYAPGQRVTLRVVRGGEVRDVDVTLGTFEDLVY